MKRIWMVLLTMLCVVSAAVAQRVSLSTSEQASLKEQVFKKVKFFQESCQLLADSTISYQKKASKGGYIDVAMLDFLGDATIRVQTADGRSFTEYDIKYYLKRLAMPPSPKASVITAVECAVLGDFVPSADKGKKGYVGRVLNKLVFDCAARSGFELVSAGDVKQGKGYPVDNVRIQKGPKDMPYLDAKIINITVKNLE